MGVKILDESAFLFGRTGFLLVFMCVFISGRGGGELACNASSISGMLIVATETAVFSA